ncbi:MAG: protein TolQ [Rhizobiales bacterium]|nr:protein TolQ [Hyphomicrobiales bacterium]
MNVLIAQATAVPQEGYSLFSLFIQATFLVQFVMVGLIVASVVCWGIIFEKMFLVTRTRRATERFEKLFWSGQSLEDLYLSLGPKNNQSMAALFMAAMQEWKRSQESAMRAGFQGVQKRIEMVMDVQLQREMNQLESRLLVLATVGSTAPFIGLFGTVWGIMNSFRAISVSKSTNLAVVAPGLAEALFATALGLLAAIPAVIFYNKFAHDIGKLGARLENFADEFGAIISRQLDERH